MNAIPFMSLSAYDIAVSRNQSPTHSRISRLERTALMITEVEYRLKQAASPLTSSGAIAVQWLRRQPVTHTVSFSVELREL